MTAAELRAAVSAPSNLRAEILALWHDAQGNWERAHAIVQDLETPEAAWVHAYLHRREGDDSNARYWYARAGKPPCRVSLDAEWDDIVTTLLRG